MGDGFKKLILRTIAFLDVVIGALTLFACIPAIASILDGKMVPETASTYVRYIGVGSIVFFATAEALSGCCYLCSVNVSLPCCFKLKASIFFSLEIFEFTVPFFVVNNYLSIVDELIATPSYYCYILNLLKVNPVSIGLFLYQGITLLVVLTLDISRKRRRPQQLLGLPLLPMVQCQPPINPSFQHAHLETVIASKAADASFSSSVYQMLRNNCLKSGVLYEDPEFPATFASLKTSNKGNEIKWKRPYEIITNPKFFSGDGINGVSRFDVKQGALGDCWLLAAVANLTLQPDLFHRVVPADNADDLKDKSRYAGICHFQFYKNGTWKDIIIDDRLPTRNGRLLFMTSADDDEFWSCLLEKAYAKFAGSYQHLDGGDIGVAMTHFTGGRVEDIRLKRNPMNISDLFQLMDTSLSTGHLLGATISDKSGNRRGLYTGHAYSVTAVKRILLKTRGYVMLLRIRNPWGTRQEWEGDWKDGHPLWDQVDKTTMKQLELIFQEDGEFWFPLKEFAAYFDLLQICYINN